MGIGSSVGFGSRHALPPIRIFILPGFHFQVVDALITNFHLPRSTLLMLVSAFAGVSSTRRAYVHAVEQRYRFFSYGDAMFITRNPAPRGPEETR